MLNFENFENLKKSSILVRPCIFWQGFYKLFDVHAVVASSFWIWKGWVKNWFEEANEKYFSRKRFFARGGDWTPVSKSEGQHSINWATQIVVKCRALFCIWSNWAGFGFLKTVDACNQLMHFLNIPHLNRKGCVINWWEVAFEDIYWKKISCQRWGLNPGLLCERLVLYQLSYLAFM